MSSLQIDGLKCQDEDQSYERVESDRVSVSQFTVENYGRFTIEKNELQRRIP